LRRAIAAALALAIVLLVQDTPTNEIARTPTLDLAHLDVRPGDVVFISVPGAFWADLASKTSLPRFRHGHVGIAVTGGAAPDIVHASGNPVAENAVVVRVPLTVFAHEAQRIDVFRPRDGAAAVRAARAAAGFAARRLPFDAAFSLQSRDSLYCTELVWRALNEGYGRDTVPRKQSIGGREMILLSDLETSPLLAPAGTAR